MDACLNATKFYILRKKQVTDQPLSEMESNVSRKIDEVLETLRNNMESSTSNLPVSNLREELTKVSMITEMVITVIENVDTAILDRIKEKIKQANEK